MILRKKQIIAILMLISPPQIGSFQTAHCSDAAAEAADYEASRQNNWDKLYLSYLRYSGCDDGSVAEGYSVSVARLLAHHWDTLPQSFPLFAGHIGFFKFVIRHINATIVDDDLKLIRANAARSCPRGGNEYCVQIAKAGEKALRDVGTTHR